MKKQYLEAGRIVSTHGVNGEVKIIPWADSPAFLQGFDVIYIDRQPVEVLSSKIHKGCLIVTLKGIDDIEAAIPLKSKTVCINRDHAALPAGRFFIQDIIGLPVITGDGVQIGTLKEVLSRPANDVYVVQGEREYLIPDVPEFIPEKNLAAGFIRVNLMEGI